MERKRRREEAPKSRAKRKEKEQLAKEKEEQEMKVRDKSLSMDAMSREKQRTIYEQSCKSEAIDTAQVESVSGGKKEEPSAWSAERDSKIEWPSNQ